MDERAELRSVQSRDAAFEPPDPEVVPFGAANKAVPLLWLGLFDYDDIEARRSGTALCLAALAPAGVAAARAKQLLAAFPPQQPALISAAKTLVRELRRVPGEELLVLHPLPVFAALRADAGAAYLQQLVALADLWERLRKGLAWEDAAGHLRRLCPEIFGVLQGDDPRVAEYYLIGSIANREDGSSELAIQLGQGPKDVDPEALVAGEQGLLLGRFKGRWKLMSSGTEHDLRGIWSDGASAYIVGNAGTVLRLRKGRAAPMETPTEATLHGVWGLSSKFVCAVGDGGTLIAFNGKIWQPWPVPSRAPLHCLGGSGPDNICVGGQEVSLLRFDGQGWTRMGLPEETMVSQIQAENGSVLAVGGSRRGGELLRLERGGWVRDPELPRTDWLEGLWRGWGGEIGVVPASGPALVHRGAGWEHEVAPVERFTAVAAGGMVLGLGMAGKEQLILRRTRAGWEREAALSELKLMAIWVAGRPKPPRLDLEQPPGASGAAESSGRT